MFLRRQGKSYPEIEQELGVARSTLSGWLSKIILPTETREIIYQRKKNHLARIRLQAAQAHKNANQKQRDCILEEIEHVFQNTVFSSVHLESLLAMLYLGEGFKMRSSIGLGNANPHILQLYVRLLRLVYTIDVSKFRCNLHLRMDQEEEKEKEFWSQTLNIPRVQFGKTQYDPRTRGRKTREHYHGVCAVYYYDARIEKRLTALQSILLHNWHTRKQGK